MLIWNRVHSGLCPFGIVFIRDCVHSGWCPFGMVSIRDGVHSGLCTGSVLQYVAKSLHENAHLAMCDCVRSITIGTGSTAKKVKSLYFTINDERTDVVTYFDSTRVRTKFDRHFNTDLQLALPLDKVLVYSTALSNEYRVHNLTNTSIFRVPKVSSTSTQKWFQV